MGDPAQDRLSQCGGGLLIGPHGVLTLTWGQGFVVGAIVILICLTISNMRRKKLLHILILTELILASLHGLWVFVAGDASGWYLSATATTLYISYNLHSIINWMKVKPFLSRWGSRFYIGTVILAMPYWIASMYLNFAYFNNLGTDAFRRTRPWEALCREPWWVFTALYLIYVIKRCYGFGIWELVHSNARFFVLLASMAISIAFMIVDIVDIVFVPVWGGRNMYWEVSLVFKCMADAAFLDDFKHVLDRLTARTTGNLLGLPPDGPNPPAQFITGNEVLLSGLSSNYTRRSQGDEESVMHIEDQQVYGSVIRPGNVHLSRLSTFAIKA